MKRFLVLCLALVYLAVSSGFTVHVHYCMGHLVGASLMGSERDDHTCSRCGMEKKRGNKCCHDEHKVFKSNADHALAKTVAVAFPVLTADLPPVFPFPANASRPLFTAVEMPVAHGPPLPPGCPIYLKVHNLRLGDCC